MFIIQYCGLGEDAVSETEDSELKDDDSGVGEDTEPEIVDGGKKNIDGNQRDTAGCSEVESENCGWRQEEHRLQPERHHCTGAKGR